MPDDVAIIGIDIGSVAIALVGLDAGGELCHHDYQCHHGHVDETLLGMLDRIAACRVVHVAVTSSTPAHLQSHARIDSRIALIRAVRQLYPVARAIVHVGGEKFGLLRFDHNGKYLGSRTNTSCAAGTGSFLDQQALRLNLNDTADLCGHAAQHHGPPPKIAVFAKTDLIHAQQEGYDLAAISAGLCLGLAENIFNALFAGETVTGPIIMCGGVAKNLVVVDQLASLIGLPIEVHPHANLFGALGAALSLKDMSPAELPQGLQALGEIVAPRPTLRRYAYGPLALRLSNFPAFSDAQSYLFHAPDHRPQNPVEVDIYCDLAQRTEYHTFLGVDIGSTSTKAVLLTAEQTVLAGFYTRTAGRPLKAMQAILAAIDDLMLRRQITIHITAAGTTGSGRKFIGRIMGADLVVDEISAHARAAFALNPEADTIIEIGGQDAKFTTLEKGAVTFAVMNTVCAAGTGSFIEEQARRLDCPLEALSQRALNQRSPMASDRCTVFMERDLHHYLSEGYTVDEVLTAVLHAVRENYLTKVAVEGRIGHNIVFQGAVAKNRALVAAFEQRLGRPIFVSRYCHLTGAMGVALMLSRQKIEQTAFRGIALWRKEIPLQREICGLCPNHCKITLATIDGRKEAYGFLCDRDYDTQKKVHRNPSGFDLLRERKKALTWRPQPVKKSAKPVIGIPAALYLYEDLALWRCFFNQLGFKVKTSLAFEQGIAAGRHAAGAQFCAPMTALHGHVRYLQDRCDHIFLPYYLEAKAKDKGVRRQYCYYTQYSVPLAAALATGGRCQGFLTPLVHYLYNSLHTKLQLFKTLRAMGNNGISLTGVSTAYDRARAFKQQGLAKLKSDFRTLIDRNEDIYVVLLGRPYTVLSPAMNKGIPDILASLGIKAFYQDMLPDRPDNLYAIAPLLKELHWHHAAAILRCAEQISTTPKAYPVLITSFKCSPDAFVIDYFRQIMSAHNKPYLVLQVDDHDARGGYETRIEAALRTFQNHHRNVGAGTPIAYPNPLNTLVPSRSKSVVGKTMLIPNWDDLSLPLVASALRREGIDARVLDHDGDSIQKSLRFNTGQCIPLNIIAQECMDYIKTHDLNPADTMLWLPGVNIACNIHLYPAHIRQALEAHGRGLEKTGVHVGPLSMSDLSMKMPLRAYFAYMFGGYLRRMGCRLRPYETIAHQTDAAISRSMTLLQKAFEGEGTYEQALSQVIALFKSISVVPESRPAVAIFGDLYARDNASINQDLIPFIEANGAEVLPTPYSDYLKMIAKPYMRKWLLEGHYLTALSYKLILAGLLRREKVYYSYFQQILKEPEPVYDDPPDQILSRYRLRPENSGESMENLIKVHYLTKHHPDIALMVQASPAFCCPALVTEAMARNIEQVTGVPIVSITYDGTGGNKNEVIIPYLTYLGSGRSIDRTGTANGRG